ncbi:hypothetical protein LUZ60_014487 [Juncus effusus]|nr:hypothetical protein LUZ60_014487 [Juncus effusus]
MTKNKQKRKTRADQRPKMAPAPAKDRLSDLPDPIIHSILSRLFIDEAVRTSVLSSRWRHLWRTNPSLRFSFTPRPDPDSPPRFTDFVEIISRCLRLCAPLEKLRSVAFPLPDDSSKATTLARWIRFASDRSVERLSLYEGVLGGGRLPVPLSLFACWSLVSLKMQSCAFHAPIPASSRFNRLETLVLDCVDIPTEAFASLLHSSPFLENLSLSSCRKLTRIAISCPSIKTIAIAASEDLEKFVIINAPKLRHFTYFGEFAKLGPLDQVQETLEEAVVISNEERPFENKRKWRDFIYALKNVKVLCIGAWFLQYELERNLKYGNQMPFFKNLRELHWWLVFKEGFGPTLANPKFSIRALISVLQNCPTLGFLCVHLNYYWEQFAEDMKSDNYLFYSDYSSDEKIQKNLN